MKLRAVLLAALLLVGSAFQASAAPARAKSTTPPTPHIYAVFPGQKMPATLEQESVWIGVVFSDANYSGYRLNLYLSPATAVCHDFNNSPSWFEFDTTGQNGTGFGSSYWWAYHASSYGSTGKANCNRSRGWGDHNGGSINGNPHSIPNFGPYVNDDILSLQIGRVG